MSRRSRAPAMTERRLKGRARRLATLTRERIGDALDDALGEDASLQFAPALGDLAAWLEAEIKREMVRERECVRLRQKRARAKRETA